MNMPHSFFRFAAAAAAVSLSCAVPLIALADDGAMPANMPNHMPPHAGHGPMMQRLQLTPVEWQRVKGIESGFLAAHDDTHPPTPQEFHAHEHDLNAALSPEHQKMLGERRWKEGRRRMQHGGMDAELHRLHLTADQWKRVHDAVISVLTPAQQTQMRQDMARMQSMHPMPAEPRNTQP